MRDDINAIERRRERQNARAMKPKSNPLTVIAVVIVMLAALVAAAWVGSNGVSSCSGDQDITVRPGDTLESIVRENVVGITSVDYRPVIDDIAAANGLSDADIGQLQIGMKIRHVPTSCGY